MHAIIIGNNEEARVTALSLPYGYEPQRSRTAIVMGILTLVMITAYIITLYSNFSVGFAVGRDRMRAADIERGNRGLELALQERERAISEGNEEIVSRMEKISGITYLTPESYAFLHQ